MHELDDAVNITLAAGRLTELGEGPVRGLGQVRDGHPVGLVGPQPLHSAHHPVIVPGLSRLSHVLTRPLHVPLVPGLVLSGAHARVCLKRQNLLNMPIYLDENQNTSQSFFVIHCVLSLLTLQ